MSIHPTTIPGYFGHGNFGFVCDNQYVDASLPGTVSMAYHKFGDMLAASTRLPPLGNAPVSAWILARFAELCGVRFPFEFGEVYGSDGDDYWLSFIAFSTDGEIRPIGKLAVIGNRTDVRLHVGAIPPYSPAQIRDSFSAVLLDSPTELRRSCVVVVYTSLEDEEHWKHVPYKLGWDGQRFIYHDSPEHTVSEEDYW